MSTVPPPSFRAVMSAALALAATAACAPTTSQSPAPKPISAYATARSFQAPAAEWPKENWWTVYGDAQLSKLIEEALEGSPTLAQAEARVRKAEYVADQAEVAGNPSIDPSAKAGVIRQSLNQGFPDQFKSDRTNRQYTGYRIKIIFD